MAELSQLLGDHPSAISSLRRASFLPRRRPSNFAQTNYVLVAEIILVNMTHLSITEDPGEEFVFRGINTITGLREDGVIFYADVTKVHVVPERETFTIQVITPALDVELDFADADSVRKALELFETKKVLEANSDPPGFVRITPGVSGNFANRFFPCPTVTDRTFWQPAQAPPSSAPRPCRAQTN